MIGQYISHPVFTYAQVNPQSLTSPFPPAQHNPHPQRVKIPTYAAAQTQTPDVNHRQYSAQAGLLPLIHHTVQITRLAEIILVPAVVRLNPRLFQNRHRRLCHLRLWHSRAIVSTIIRVIINPTTLVIAAAKAAGIPAIAPSRW